jgi:UDP-N-acetylmuramyl tripeptide synthase
LDPPASSFVGLRTRAATGLGSLAAAASRRLGRGDGSVIGGRVVLALDPRALGQLAAGRAVAVVRGTNGKTTTTRLLAEAVATRGRVVTNAAGANLPSGLVATLSAASPGAPAVLEVDERYVPTLAPVLRPVTLTLLNLSRDQLDRFGEVRSLAAAWRAAVAGMVRAHVIANADDPLVAWAALPAGAVTWVAAGQAWTEDSVGCPACSGPIDREGGGWSCRSCGLRRPEPDLWLEGSTLRARDGGAVELSLALPGQWNLANAAMAAGAAMAMGVPVDTAAAAMRHTADVAGRYRTVRLDGVDARLLLAKNPAGWSATFSLLAPPPAPVVVGINARIADGRDTSWLWDVPFERLAGRPVVAAGERCHDIAVRLRYAGIEHVTRRDLRDAVRAAGGPHVEVTANYTAFQQLLAALARDRSLSRSCTPDVTFATKKDLP